MTARLELRQLVAGDVPDLHDILRGSELESSWPRATILDELKHGFGYGYVTAERVVAFVLFRKADEVWEVSVLGTAVSEQRKGLMRQLLTAILVFPGAQIREIWLEVNSGNEAALNLYTQLGYQTVGRRSRYYRDGGDAILMSLSLAKSR